MRQRVTVSVEDSTRPTAFTGSKTESPCEQAAWGVEKSRAEFRKMRGSKTLPPNRGRLCDRKMHPRIRLARMIK